MKKQAIPLKGYLHLPGGTWQEDWENLEAESDVPWTPEHTREASWESPKALETSAKREIPS